MEAVLMGTARLLASLADRQTERKQRRSLSGAIQQAVVVRVLKLLLHTSGFGAFIWSMFQVHSVAGGLSIMVSCFVFSWLIGGQPQVEKQPMRDPALRG